MIVVSDAGPIHYLVLIGQIELLPALYGQVVVPVTVVNELQHLHTPATVRAWIGAPPTWLDIRKTDVDPTGNSDAMERETTKSIQNRTKSS